MSDREQSSYTISANLKWFGIVYLIVLVASAVLAAWLETIGISLPLTGLGIGVYAGVVGIAGQRFAERRDWTGRDRNLLALGYVTIATVLSLLLGGALLLLGSTSLAIITSGGAYIGILVGALIFAALIYYGTARLMLMLIARRRERDAWQNR